MRSDRDEGIALEAAEVGDEAGGEREHQHGQRGEAAQRGREALHYGCGDTGRRRQRQGTQALRHQRRPDQQQGEYGARRAVHDEREGVPSLVDGRLLRRRRGRIELGAAALLCGEVLAFAAFFPVQAIMHGVGAGLSIRSPGALRAVLSAGFHLAVVALIGLALGALLRHTAGAIAALFGLGFILPGVVSAFPQPWSDRIGRFLPTNCIGRLLSQQAHPADLTRPWSFVVLVAYPAVLLGVAGYVLRRRDVWLSLPFDCGRGAAHQREARAAAEEPACAAAFEADGLGDLGRRELTTLFP
ncbi:ABC transporter permease subunit [Actinocrinis puniceicyclus]|uniref:ABC transporter permease subunit n=1 Tax=Actinocrinis puniceicyclus TaxID=977794 RepID=A0A8J7WP89_9ACTN|nr:ABC transporter permease subunit [Actinocrinis puniceicyclus]MBS2963494.1 ABC transporter permease subunit [Actinocrinis puniceicyclus]